MNKLINVNSLDLSNQPKGIYSLTHTGGNGQVIQRNKIERITVHNSRLAKVGDSCFYDSLVVCESNEMLKDDRNRNKRKRNEQTSQRFSKIKRTATYHTMPKLCSTFTFAQPKNQP